MRFTFCFNIFAFIYCTKGVNWKINSRQAQWNTNSVRKNINQTIVEKSFKSGSLFLCEYTCTTYGVPYVLSLYYVSETRYCYCNSNYDTALEDSSAKAIYYGEPKLYIQSEENDSLQPRSMRWPYLRDCLELNENGLKIDGSYSITGWDGNVIYTQCDMTNGGWTVIQNRFDGSVNFNREWSEYRLGFGDVYSEYWIGLENIHNLTYERSSLSLYVEAFPESDPKNATIYNEYFHVHDCDSNFLVESSEDIHACGANSEESFFNGKIFSSPDRSNGIDCAPIYGSGWWYSMTGCMCFSLNLNGKYFTADDIYLDFNNFSTFVNYRMGIHCYACWFFLSSQKKTQMKVRRVRQP